MPAPFTVVLKNRTGTQLTEGGHPVDVRVVDGHGCLLPVEQTDNQDGTLSMSYTPNDIGRHEIVVSHKDQPIGSSPFIVDVQLPEGGAHCPLALACPPLSDPECSGRPQAIQHDPG